MPKAEERPEMQCVLFRRLSSGKSGPETQHGNVARASHVTLTAITCTVPSQQSVWGQLTYGQHSSSPLPPTQQRSLQCSEGSRNNYERTRTLKKTVCKRWYPQSNKSWVLQPCRKPMACQRATAVELQLCLWGLVGGAGGGGILTDHPGPRSL